MGRKKGKQTRKFMTSSQIPHPRRTSFDFGKSTCKKGEITNEDINHEEEKRTFRLSVSGAHTRKRKRPEMYPREELKWKSGGINRIQNPVRYSPENGKRNSQASVDQKVDQRDDAHSDDGKADRKIEGA
jgi:hypothetical protein